MDEKRKDAQKLELSAQAEGSSEALQLDPSDLSADFSVSGDKSTSKLRHLHKPKATQPGLENNIFNALVAPPSTRTTPPEDRVAIETSSASANTLDVADALNLNLTTSPVDPIINDPPQPVLDQVQVPSIESIVNTQDPMIDQSDELTSESGQLDEPLITDADEIIDRIAAEVFEDIENEDPSPQILKLPLPEEADSQTPDYDDWEPLPPEMGMRIVPQQTVAEHEVIVEEPIDVLPDEMVIDEGAIETPAIEAPAVEVELIEEEVPKTFYDPAAVIPDEPVAELPVEIDAPSFDFSALPIQSLDADVEVPIHDTSNVILSQTKNLNEDQQNQSQLPGKTEVEIVNGQSPVIVELKPAAEAEEEPASSTRTGAWWSIPLLCMGIAIAACAILVPMADENRRVSHELAQIDQDVAYFQKQSDVNKEFLERVSSDPTLAERLALRQLRLTRADSRLANIPQKPSSFGMSPYQLVAVEPPVKLPEYQPIGGFLSKYFLSTKTQIYLTGLGILLAAAGVILGGGNDQKPVVQEESIDELSTAEV